MFSNVWSENTALFERLMEIHSIHQNYTMALMKENVRLLSINSTDLFGLCMYVYQIYLPCSVHSILQHETMLHVQTTNPLLQWKTQVPHSYE